MLAFRDISEHFKDEQTFFAAFIIVLECVCLNCPRFRVVVICFAQKLDNLVSGGFLKKKLTVFAVLIPKTSATTVSSKKK